MTQPNEQAEFKPADLFAEEEITGPQSLPWHRTFTRARFKPFTEAELRYLMRQGAPKFIPDGPVPCGKQNEFCIICLAVTDLYYFSGGVFCGDCRYRIRHDRDPPRNGAYWQASAAEIITSDDAPAEVHLIGQFRSTRVPSVKYAELLMQIEREQMSSLDVHDGPGYVD